MCWNGLHDEESAVAESAMCIGASAATCVPASSINSSACTHAPVSRRLSLAPSAAALFDHQCAIVNATAAVPACSPLLACVTAKDTLGHSTTVCSNAITVDTTVPTVEAATLTLPTGASVMIDGGMWASSFNNATLAWRATNGSCSGVEKFVYSVMVNTDGGSSGDVVFSGSVPSYSVPMISLPYSGRQVRSLMDTLAG